MTKKESKRRVTRLRLGKDRAIPANIDNQIAQGERLIRELITGVAYFMRDPRNWHDGPARRRLQENRQKLGDVGAKLHEEAPEQWAAVQGNWEDQLQVALRQYDDLEQGV